MKYGFLGCGNMGGAIATALANVTTDILITDRTGKAKILAEKIGCQYADASKVASSCDRIFLAVKPQIMQEALDSIAPVLRERKVLIITMAAGLTIERIEKMIGASLPVIRIMPNTPVAVGCGMTLYCANDLVSAEMLEDFLNDMRYCGQFDALSESLIDVGSAISGSGPAYLYLFAEALASAADECGIDREQAIMHAAATMVGAGQMMLKSGIDPADLRKAVCSPGGSTLEGLKALESNHFEEAIHSCVLAAYHRNQELGKK